MGKKPFQEGVQLEVREPEIKAGCVSDLTRAATRPRNQVDSWRGGVC